MKLLHFTDLHMRPAGKLAYGKVDSNAIARHACAQASTLGADIDAVLITGDLTDCGLPAEYAELNAALAALAPRPVFLLPGNHDRREAMLAHIPGLRHEGPFIHYAVEDFPVRILMLDSVVPGETHGEFCAERLAWIERTLAAQPERETLLALHHPPLMTGIPQFDDIGLRGHEAFAALVARHPQVRRIVSGHHHRIVYGSVAQAICTVAPAIAYQFELTFDPAVEVGFVLEPSAFLVHDWAGAGGCVTHVAYAERFPGPFPIALEDDYPGTPARAEPPAAADR